MTNLGSVLEAAGATFNNGEYTILYYVSWRGVCVITLVLLVMKTTVMMADIADYAKINDVYLSCT